MSSEYQNLPPATRQAVMSAAEAIAPEQSAQDVRESLSVTDKGKTANTIDNCRIVFCCDPLLRDAIRLNLLTDRVALLLNARERALFGSDIGKFHSQVSLGLKFIIN